MNIYDMRTEAMENPLLIDKKTPSFSWKLYSKQKNVIQESYRISVRDENNEVWDSGTVKSDKSVNIRCCGAELIAETRYFWTVTVTDNFGRSCTSKTAWFETGLMGNSSEVWSGAEWIGSPEKTINTDGLDTYELSADFEIKRGKSARIAINARNKDNYVLIEADFDSQIIKVMEYCDNAWTDGMSDVRALGNAEGYKFYQTDLVNNIRLTVEKLRLTVVINGQTVIDGEEILPAGSVFEPRKQYLMNFGFKHWDGCVLYRNIRLKNTLNGDVYTEKNEINAENEFVMINPCPAVNVKRDFEILKKVKSARLYASARGFYEAYLNGDKVNDSFYNPGFTDYRKRIFYQSYDITDKIRQGSNTLGAVVTKGYYSGFVGYSALPMVYGEQNSFIAKLVVKYEDGTDKIIVTDGSWLFTDNGAVVDADYQQGEVYDARLDFNDTNDLLWQPCGVIPPPAKPEVTNGSRDDLEFELAAQEGPSAVIERVLKAVSVIENPKGHFVYDFGQNIVGTVRLEFQGKRGQSVKIRYGEMCYKDGRLYTANLRSAANTDVYTFCGDEEGESFVPSMTSHGFRYIEITGNGYELTDNPVMQAEGLVITNTPELTGFFECSNADINQLQKNIQWGQRGNSLLVYTDCPQRNERMGWTGDAQVFAKTAAYNMDVKAFMNKWLSDLRESQIMYNRDGAVPDTAPLGGDNRPMGGCAGWGDAAVIVPWEMYMAYGDISIIEDNYDMMKLWVDYQSRSDRQNCGTRIVDGREAKSDMSSEPFIQIQQSRGDHLAFDESTPFILSATAYAARVSEILADAAKLLGKEEDEKKYRNRYENVKRAFNEAWIEEDGSIAYWGEQSKSNKDTDGNVINKTYYTNNEGSTAIPSQTAYALAIDFGLIPKNKLNRAAQCFEAAVNKSGEKLSVGFLGISHLAPALTKAGLNETAFRLLEQTNHPSWLYSVKNGATTIWERWNSYIAETDTFGAVSMNSFNHYAYGAIGEWLFGNIAGINTGTGHGETGYKKIILKPSAGGSLTYAKGCCNSAYGRIYSAWEIKKGRIKYECEIPANTSAVLYLLAANEAKYNGIKNEKAPIKLGSGKYVFEGTIK